MELKLNMDFEQLIALAKQLSSSDKLKLINALQKSMSNSKNKRSERELGKYEGKVWMSDDFNEPLDDFNQYSE